MAQLSVIDDNFDEIFGAEYTIPETRLPSHANHFRKYISNGKFRFSCSYSSWGGKVSRFSIF